MTLLFGSNDRRSKLGSGLAGGGFQFGIVTFAIGINVPEVAPLSVKLNPSRRNTTNNTKPILLTVDFMDASLLAQTR